MQWRHFLDTFFHNVFPILFPTLDGKIALKSLKMLQSTPKLAKRCIKLQDSSDIKIVWLLSFLANLYLFLNMNTLWGLGGGVKSDPRAVFIIPFFCALPYAFVLPCKFLTFWAANFGEKNFFGRGRFLPKIGLGSLLTPPQSSEG